MPRTRTTPPTRPTALLLAGLALPGGLPGGLEGGFEELAPAALVLAPDPPPAERSLVDALVGGDAWIVLRYRYENVEQDSFSKDARASTLRTVLGYRTAPWHGFAAVLEFEDVTPIGQELYDSTVNGVTDRPVVADPDGSEVNQVYLEYAWDADEAGEDRWQARLGRQRITLDNHRFVGNVGWRQNEQTFDAVSAGASELGHFDLFAAFVRNVNRVFGDDSPQGDHGMKSVLLNAAREFELEGLERAVLYVYHLDYDDVDTLSSTSVGVRCTGTPALGEDLHLPWAFEVAGQADTGDNPNDYDAVYVHAEVGLELERVTAGLGGELLGGDGTPNESFQTPLATLHAFNGWADQFLSTPPDGLQDVYVSLGSRAGRVDLVAVWHDFRSDHDDLHYGTELDLGASFAFAEHFTVGVNLADFRADDLADDVRKAWIWLSASL